MCSRRAACESITTRRRFFPPALVSPEAGFVWTGFACACASPSLLGAAAGVPSLFEPALAAGFGMSLVAVFGFSLVAVPPPEPLRAASASDSSTLDWAAFASIPAEFSAARTSLLVRPWAFAIS